MRGRFGCSLRLVHDSCTSSSPDTDRAASSVPTIALYEFTKERFLRAGVDPAAAMQILNSVLLLRGADSWGYATVDLMCVDLFSGEACFYKYGAAPSFVKTGKTIRRIDGESLAAGLTPADGAPPDVVRMRLKPGSLAVIASDGVLAAQEDGWIKALLSEDQDDMKRLARTVLHAAEKLYGSGDDMTVLTVRVEERR